MIYHEKKIIVSTYSTSLGVFDFLKQALLVIRGQTDPDTIAEGGFDI